MRIFHYDAHTGAFLEVGEADADPMTPGNWLVPAHATPIEVPGSVDGMAWVFNLAVRAWSAVPDFREVPLFSKEDGSPFELSDDFNGLGDLPEGLTTVERPSEAHVWRDGTWQFDPALSESLARQANQATRAELLVIAKAAMEILQIAVDIDEATEAEAAKLLAWKRYVVALSRVNVAAPVWPDVPAA